MERVINVTRKRCLLAMISAAVVVICVFVGVTMNLTTVYDENFDHMGLRTFCMFTVNSNILCGISMALLFPYTLDGLRKHNYHIPRWAVVLAFAGVTAVTLTFLVSLFLLAPVKGFVLIFSGSRFFLHGLCPILAITAFCVFINEQPLSFTDTFFALIPDLIYALVYTFMVLGLGEDKGGWSDFYEFFTRVKPWVSLVAIMPLTFLIATGIRLLHNRSYRYRREEEAACFSEMFADTDVRKAVAAMARWNSMTMKVADIIVPARVISIMLENSKTEATLEECCRIYLNEYFDNQSMLKLEKMWI